MRTVNFQLTLGDKVIDIDRIEWRKGKPYRAGYYDKELDKTHWFYLGTKLGYSLRESTGLKDKKGVEIFEGDIIDTTIKAGKIMHVVWDEGALTWGLVDPRSGHRAGDGYLDATMSYVEVIGNIYENPELLQPTKPHKEG